MPAGTSERATACAGWLRQLARASKIARLYKTGPLVDDARRIAHAKLADVLERFGPLTLKTAPTELFAGDECLMGPPTETDGIVQQSDEEQLATLLFRDGIRQITFSAGTPRSDIDALIDALSQAGLTFGENEDLVCLLWDANLSHVHVTSVPYPQAVVHRPEDSEQDEDALPDDFEDRPLPDQGLDVAETFRRLEATAEASRARLIAAWRSEAADLDHRAIGAFLRDLLGLDPGPDMRRAVSRFIVSWLPEAIVTGDWTAARYAHELLREVEPNPAIWNDVLAGFLSKLDPVPLAERLERSEGSQISAFIEVALAMGPAAVDMVCSVMAEAEEPASRAATEVALAIMCAGAPERLEPYLHDPRWFVVRNAVQVLGMIGGEGVGRLLRIAIGNSDERVVKEAIRSLARAPREEGLPVLIELLHTRDLKILSTTLSVLARERNPAAARALLGRIESPEFESENEELQRQVFTGLAEIAGDESVLPLSSIVQKSGLFVRKTLTRTAAAHTLARIGTERAVTALEAGLKSKHEAVRSTCRDALEKPA